MLDVRYVMLSRFGHRGLCQNHHFFPPPKTWAVWWIDRRTFVSTVLPQPHRKETVEVPVGGHGRVRLDFLHPAPSPSGALQHGRNLVVCLPPGPSTPGSERATIDDDVRSVQTVLPPTTSLVKVHYRLGPKRESLPDTRFPIAIHDVATAFSYLTSSASPVHFDPLHPPKICLVGTHIGGALAAMLALTEPTAIHAVALVEPLVDWVSLDDLVGQLSGQSTDTSPSTSSSPSPLARKRQKQKQKQKGTHRLGVDDNAVLAAAEDLVRLRARLFPTPSSYFDPFASPVLFLRAPGRDTPLDATVGDELVRAMDLDDVADGLSRHDEDLFGPYDDVLGQSGPETDPSQPLVSRDHSSPPPPATIDGSTSPSPSSPLSQDSSQPTPRRRKVLRRWPSTGRPESTLLPHVKIFVADPARSPLDVTTRGEHDTAQGHAALMRLQGIELADLLRRACFYGREKGFADERVSLDDGRHTPPRSASEALHEMQLAAWRWTADMLE